MSALLDALFDDGGIALARLIVAGDSDGAARHLIAAVERGLGRPATRDERNYCFVSAMLAILEHLSARAEQWHRDDLDEHYKRLAEEGGPDPMRARYERWGICYTLDACRLVDRSITDQMMQRRGRVLAVYKEYVRVAWYETWAGLPIDTKKHRLLCTRDEHWRSLTLFGHRAMMESTIPGPNCCGPKKSCSDPRGFDPTTGMINDEGKRYPYKPIEPFDVRVFAP
jgi:hypothetical protein